ncbi:MAG: GAF domain-containing protein [Gaiellaceae bacterium]
MSSVSDPKRLRALVEAGVALSSELSLDAVLDRIVEAAAEVTGARYAALGVIDSSGRELERFVTHGIGEEARAAIGELPRGRGILGALIDEARLLRLDDLNADPRAVGFPPNHPPMRSFLGVPILLRGIAYGDLYLTEKEGAGFDEGDEDLVRLLGAQAAVAIENARLYEAARRWSHQLESMNEIGTALVGELELDRLLELVAERLRELLDARLVVVVLPDGDAIRVVAAAGKETGELIGLEFDRTGSKIGHVLQRARSERVDSIVDDPRSTRLRRAGLVPAAGSMCRSWPARARSGSSPPTTSSGRTRASTRRISGSPRVSQPGPPWPWNSRSGWGATRYGGSWPDRSRSGGGSRASCTTRPRRR